MHSESTKNGDATFIAQVCFTSPAAGGLSCLPFSGMKPAFTCHGIYVSAIVRLSEAQCCTHDTWLRAAIYVFAADSYPTDVWTPGFEFDLTSGANIIAKGRIKEVAVRGSGYAGFDDFCKRNL
ncbi:MAG: hypothetical protein ABJZ55_02945 [Fuerstiella sp.]